MIAPETIAIVLFVLAAVLHLLVAAPQGWSAATPLAHALVAAGLALGLYGLAH